MRRLGMLLLIYLSRKKGKKITAAGGSTVHLQHWDSESMAMEDSRYSEGEMAMGGSHLEIWKQIERSESYLVCSMFEEAASLASSIAKQLCSDDEVIQVEDDIQLHDMLESSGMVLVQSLKELARASEILNELKQSFSSVAAIPIQVVLTGACFQLSETTSGVQEFLEEFLRNWTLVDERYYVAAGAEATVDYVEGCDGRSVLGVDKYLDVVDLYVMKVLGTTQNDMDLAISWLEKAELPENGRQELVRRVHSLHSLKASNASLPEDNHKAHAANLRQPNGSQGSSKVLDSKYPLNGENTGKQAVLKLSKRVEPCFWWLRTISMNFGNARLFRLVISNGKILLGCLIMIVYWILRRKQTNLKRIVKKQALYIKKGVVDLWQLAFSYQVNPLATVQSPLAPLRGAQQRTIMH